MNEDFQGLCDEAESWKAHSMNQDFCGGRKERPASAAKAYQGIGTGEPQS
jgi:hypothetical protein